MNEPHQRIPVHGCGIMGLATLKISLKVKVFDEYDARPGRLKVHGIEFAAAPTPRDRKESDHCEVVNIHGLLALNTKRGNTQRVE